MRPSLQTPARLSPFVNPEQARARRDNYVLPRMAAEGFISREDAADSVGPSWCDHGDTARMRAALHAVNLCCIGETIATAFVEACVAECASAELRDVHGRHLADEIDHARVGWAHLASLPVDERAEIATWIPKLLKAQVETWEERLGELPEAGIAGHGYPPRATLLQVVHGAVREVVLPGFEYLGLDVATARAWFEDHAR